MYPPSSHATCSTRANPNLSRKKSAWSGGEPALLNEDGVSEEGQQGSECAGGRSFSRRDRLRTVSLPRSLKTVGNYEFWNFRALVVADVPDGVCEIGRAAFMDCTSLVSATIPEGVVYLPGFAFDGCKSLASVRLPSSLRIIGEYDFFGCSSLSSINFDALSGVTEIGGRAFCNCSSLTSFKVPPLLRNIERYTFCGCETLEMIELPRSLETIKASCFNFCPDYLTFYLPDTKMCVESNAFQNFAIRLPTSLSMLSNRVRSRGVFRGVREVVISSRVDLRKLASYIGKLPKTFKKEPFLDPNLKFKFLYSGSASSSPSINSHVHESYFSLDLTVGEVLSYNREGGSLALRKRVDDEFCKAARELSLLLSSNSACGLPPEVLYVVLPFVHGGKITEEMIGEVVNAIGKVRSEGGKGGYGGKENEGRGERRRCRAAKRKRRL